MSPVADAGHTEERAGFWRVTTRTIRRWRAQTPAVPVDDVPAMIKWHATLPFTKQSKLSPAFLRRLTELRMKLERSTGSPVAADPYYDEFVTARPASADPAAPAAHATDGAYLADLKRRRDFALFKLDRAQARNDLAAADDAARLLKLVAPIIHDEELRAQKLNREIGEMLPRAAVEAMIRSLVYWHVRLADQTLSAAEAQLTVASAAGPLYREEIRARLEPLLLSRHVYEPLRRATGPDAPLALPAWVLEKMNLALASHLEDVPAEVAPVKAAPPPA